MNINPNFAYVKKVHRGFTMMELIMVIVLVGILAAIAGPRWIGQTEFDARGFYDQTLGMLRYAQKVAIAQRRDVWVQVDQATGNICLTYLAVDPNCATNLTTSTNAVLDPANGAWFKKTTPKNVTLGSSFSFKFTALGRPNPNVSQSIVITGGASGGGTIVVESETGYVH